jgi:hypothetical protein
MYSSVVRRKNTEATGKSMLRAGKNLPVALFLLLLAHPVCKGFDWWQDREVASPARNLVGRVFRHQGQVHSLFAGWRHRLPVVPGQRLSRGEMVATGDSAGTWAEVALLSGGTATLGPGTTVLFSSPWEVELVAGQMEVAPPDGRILRVGAADSRGGGTIRCSERILLAYKSGRLQASREVPGWLAGVQRGAGVDPLGELHLGGDSQILAPGTQAVGVEVHDQLVRAAVESVFVNPGATVADAIYRLPLPPGATVVDFAYTEDGSLVRPWSQGDARSGREDALPTLAAGTQEGVFTAGIGALAHLEEKRIRVTYTQLLSMEDGMYSYLHPMASNEPRERPLRSLDIRLRLTSGVPVKRAFCRTHPGHLSEEDGEVHFRYRAWNVSPDRDFEFDVIPEPGDGHLAVHAVQVGGDGYCALRADAPLRTQAESPGGQIRDESLRMVFLADTSASMSSAARNRQSEFLRVAVRSLVPGDRFAIAALDASTQWLTDGWCEAGDDKTLANALERLDSRAALGWTEFTGALDSCVDVILKDMRTGPAPSPAAFRRTWKPRPEGLRYHIVYVGDGVSTAPGEPLLGLLHNASENLRERAGADSLPEAELNLHAVRTTCLPGMSVVDAARVAGGATIEMHGAHAPGKAARSLLEFIVLPGAMTVRMDFADVWERGL